MGVRAGSPRLISTAIVALATLVLVFAGFLAWRAHARYRAAEQVVLANRVADRILLAAGIEAMERGMTAAALGAGSTGTGLRARLAELRRHGDAHWIEGARIARRLVAEQGTGSPLAAALAAAERGHRALRALRERVDRHLAGAGDVTVAEWVRTITGFIAAAARVREAAFAASDVAPEVQRPNLTLRHWIWLTAEHAGLERGVLAYYVSARRPVPPAVLDELKAYRGVVERNLRELLAVRAQPGADARIVRAIERMRREFLGRFERTRAQIYAAAASGRYPLSGAEWWAAATRAVDAILAVGEAVSAVTNERAAAVARRSVRELAGFGVLAALTLGVAAFSVTRVRQTANALFHEKERAEVTLHSIGDAVIITDAAARVEYLNPLAEELTGWRTEEAAGRPLREVFNIVNGFTRAPEANPVEICLRENRVVGLSNNALLVSRDGREYMVEDSAAPIRDREGRIVGAVMVFYDVTSMRHAPHILSYHATHDALTGLVNRREFERRLVELLTDAKASGRDHALCYVDLDQFKLVNDTCGHAAGDRLLRQLTYLLQQRLRDTDTLARLGGDEFGVLLVNCPLPQALRIAQELCRVVKDFRFQWNDQVFDISASIGLVPVTRESANPQELLSQADAACFAAKEKGRNRVQVYRPEDTEVARRHGEMQWVPRILRAMEKGRLRLYCQPIVPLRGGAERRCEILLRMLDEQGELIPPGAFIPAAERYGLMPQVDRWVVERALTTLEGRLGARMCAINISGASLGDRDFLGFVREQLRRHAIPPGAICFEITETAAVVNLQEAANFIETLRAEGCCFALDDFGSGLSSFTYLKNLPVDFLKIDGTFVRDLVDDPLDHAMVRAINEIGHLMGVRTVAEFVEDETVLARLREMGVDYAQGFGIARPHPIARCVVGCGG